MTTLRNDILVVGAGFAGAIIAERLASAGRQVTIFEAREHIAGNAFDHADAHGVLVHRYGPHIFHTNSDEVVAYLSRFTTWHPFQHQVKADIDGRLYPVPINRTTLQLVYGDHLVDEAAAEALLARIREPITDIRTSEDVVLAGVGRRLYELFFRGYTRKQWKRDPKDLDAQVTARIPVRTNLDDRYFSDKHQIMPRDGFTAMFARILDHPNIRLELGRRFDPAKDRQGWKHIIYTGPVDSFYGHCHGPLPYRSLRFEHQHLAERPWFQPAPVVNYPSEVIPFTRITEFKHLTGQVHAGTSIVREYPADEGDPYYPIPAPDARALYLKYQAMAEAETDVTFVGRLAQYRYFNMDQAAAAALTQAKKLGA